MKKVWVLEKFVDTNEMQKGLNDLLVMREANKDNPENLKVCDDLIKAEQKKMDENPNGYWCGYEGKVIYKQFCSCAKDFIFRHKKDVRNGNWKLRVVEGEILDDSVTWLGYKIVKENAGVLKYLLATTL